MLLAVVGLCPMAVPQNAGPDAALSQRLLPFLNQAVQWRRDQLGAVPLADQPSDVFFTADVQATADQVTRLAFDYAHAEAATVSSPTAASSSAQGKLGTLLTQAQSDVASTQKELEALDRQPARTRKERDQITAQRQELQSELDLANARVATLEEISGFIRSTTARNNGGSLADQIDQLERSVIGLAAGKDHHAAGWDRGGSA